MAVALTGAASTGTSTGQTSTTVAHTNPADGDLLIVAVGTGEGAAPVVIGGVTYNGDALTPIPLFLALDGVWVQIAGFYRLAPDVGSSLNVVVSHAAQPDQAGVVVQSFSGVHQTVPFGTAVTNSGSGTTASVGVGSGATDLVYFAIQSDAEGGITEGGTLIAKTAAIDGDTICGAQYYAGTGGTVTGSWTQADTGWVCGGVAIKPAAVGGGLGIPLAMHHYRQLQGST